MNLNTIGDDAQILLLIFARVFALLRVAPVLSSAAIPRIARTGLAVLIAFLVYPHVSETGYPIPDTAGALVLLLIGEVLLGVITGLILDLILSAVQTAGQLFSLQMGFGASQVFDPLAQVTIPLLGQFFNLVALLVLVVTEGLNKIMLTGVIRSFDAVRAVDLVFGRRAWYSFFLGGLTRLFEQAMIISMPILGTLFVLQITMGLLAKAAPQMNLLMLGFPLAIGVAFIVIFLTMPFLMESFEALIDGAHRQILRLYSELRGVT